MESLKARTARGIFWSFMDSFGVYLIKFFFSIVIARTLSPEDYGLMGMIVIFISLGQMIMQSGFSSALIQKKACTTTDLSTAFWFNLVAALIIYILLFFSAGAIASLFQKPILIPITRVSAIGILLNALSSVHTATLIRGMDFKKITWINLGGALISGTTGLVMALHGYEVWALVFQTLVGSFIYLTGLWITSNWIPRLVFDIESLRSLFKFGYKILLQGLTDVIFTKLYFPLIGKFYTTSQLGFYTNANRFYEVFVRQTTTSFTRVMFPAFAGIQDERKRFNSNYVRSFNLMTALMFIVSVILIISSRPFVSIALTEKWLPAVPFMQLFFIEGFLFPLLMFNQNIILAVGRSGLFLKIDIIKKGLTLLSIILLFRLGIRALIIGQVTATGLTFLISIAGVVKTQEIMLREIVIPLIKLSGTVILCLAFNYLLVEPLAVADWIDLLLKCTLIPVLFYGLTWLFQMNLAGDVKGFLKGNNWRLEKSPRPID
jgi:teichuronic acid exporter